MKKILVSVALDQLTPWTTKSGRPTAKSIVVISPQRV